MDRTIFERVRWGNVATVALLFATLLVGVAGLLRGEPPGGGPTPRAAVPVVVATPEATVEAAPRERAKPRRGKRRQGKRVTRSARGARRPKRSREVVRPVVVAPPAGPVVVPAAPAGSEFGVEP